MKEVMFDTVIDFVVFFLIAFGSFIFGTFAFAQIIGSIRARKYLSVIIFWSVLVIAVTTCFVIFWRNYIWEYLVPLAISFIVMLSQKNIT